MFLEGVPYKRQPESNSSCVCIVPTWHPADKPDTIPVTFVGFLTNLSPHRRGALCAPSAMATVNFMGARTVA
jgi:hypothetical protein